ncbi:MoaD/ThiS family protein [Salegentibacter sp. BDJ18]|uniref:MoaD/ThiS family protein n=1 Tax=Salegentibacter sp. BDJ18 TaxID=2816376 RepID=UPI001AAE9E1A|nr:MoaD/ThiS family protein [Salegentibacter sp. BDJ18]MBO2542840.1 MoaD/ThiS family protein [Salegentibacter sp. BDJ18]|tara:strand:+ start:774 stop:1010 length:237 start_codon:yes stop_codon:yes gene_type:complete
MEGLTVKAFGMIAEKLPEQEFKFPKKKDTEELLNSLYNEYPDLKELDFSLAVNQQLIQENTSLEGDEEIALLPPFSGG